MHTTQIALLAVIQGLAELLPVSSSAHVIVAEKLMRIDPSSPEMTFLLVMLHTGTMFAVLFYFRSRWSELLRYPSEQRRDFVRGLIVATGVTAVVGLGLKKLIEKFFFAGVPHAEIELLFANLPLIAGSLFSVGVLIFIAGLIQPRTLALKGQSAVPIGAIQGLCLPFRGFSRSGATISMGLLTGLTKNLAEEFSFALAVVLTPPVVARELHRLIHSRGLEGTPLTHLILPGLLGMVFSFIAGMLALRWVSRWIENGKWSWFGYYCFAASAVVLLVHWKLG